MFRATVLLFTFCSLMVAASGGSEFAAGANRLSAAGYASSGDAVEELFYDSGEPGFGNGIDTARYHAVRFDPGLGMITGVRAFLVCDSLSGRVRFNILDESEGGFPGVVAWTSEELAVEEEGWYTIALPDPDILPVAGPFYIAVRPIPGSGHIRQFFDDDGPDAPLGTQWTFADGVWGPGEFRNEADLMIRARFRAVVNPVPVLIGIEPSRKTVGEDGFTMIVRGRDFLAGSELWFNGSPRPTSFFGDSTILLAQIPASDLTTAGSFVINVFNPGPGGGASNPVVFTVGNPRPVLTGIDPNSRELGGEGFTMLLRGNGFLRSSEVRFEGEPRETEFILPSLLLARFSSSDLTAAGEFAITVYNPGPGGGESNRQILAVTEQPEEPDPKPELVVIIPDSGQRGHELSVDLYGINFESGMIVEFAGDDIIINDICYGCDKRVRVDIFIEPHAQLTERDVTVTTSAGTAVLEEGFRVVESESPPNPEPRLYSISPAVGARGRTERLEFHGAGFVPGVTTVSFPGCEVVVDSVMVVSGSELVVSVGISDEAEPGRYDVALFNPLPGGGRTKLAEVFEVVEPYHDVGVTAILRPAGNIFQGGEIQPELVVDNFGWFAESFDVELVIEGCDGVVYRQVEMVHNLAVGESRTYIIQDSLWNANLTGRYNVTAMTRLARDENPANDVHGPNCFDVVSAPDWQEGWQEVAPITASPYNRRDVVSHGGWLAFNAGDGRVYAAKGNGRVDFFAFDPEDGEGDWTGREELADIPTDPDRGRPIGRGACAAADGDNFIYMTYGNNTRAFWCYDIAADTWEELAGVPPGGSGRPVRDGSDMVYVNGHLYLLKGDRTEFWQYSVADNAWEPRAAAPTGSRARWPGGSWLAWDGDNTIFAHKARHFDRSAPRDEWAHELWAYDIAEDEWRGPLAGMPLLSQRIRRSRRSSREGASGVHDNGLLYALKGGNTGQFWRYNLSGNVWQEVDSMPSVDSDSAGRHVDAGGSLVRYGDGVFFAFKGNRTSEMWRYVVPASRTTAARPESNHSGEMAGKPFDGQHYAVIEPNPVSGGMTSLRYSLPDAGLLQVRVFDVTGREVLFVRLPGHLTTGTVPFDLHGLSAGVYLVQVEAGEFGKTRKLVVQR